VHLATCWYFIVMAANENCTISLMGGDDPGISPLQIFVRAKEEINDIFMKIEDYVRDTVTYMQSKYKWELT